MKYLITVLLMFVSLSAHTGTSDELIEEIQGGQLSLSTIAALNQLDNREFMTGYGLCMAANRSTCVPSGSVGYGLCMAANRNSCVQTASIGYGLCMAANRNNCDPNASLGYGLCMVANRSNCDPAGTIGYGLCMAANRSTCLSN